LANSIQDTVDTLNQLLDSCEGLSVEHYVKPFHVAAFVALNEPLETALVKKLHEWKYRPLSNSHLILEELHDWKAEILNAPFFSFGLEPLDKREVPGYSALEAHEKQTELIQRFLNVISSAVSPEMRGFRLSSNDTAGQMLCPYGGCHDYFVLVDCEFAFLIDFDWDS
jgi:hypothetical protein